MLPFRLAYILAVVFGGLVLSNCTGDDPGCTTSAHCPEGRVCNPVTGNCEICTPDCTGKCSGGDGCGGTCPGHCTETQCCVDNTCTEMSCGVLKCGPDPVCQKECGPCEGSDHCVFGVCQTGPAGGNCPAGQDCIQMIGDGSMGCIIPPNNIPPDNPTDCITTECQGNYSCYCRNQDCSATQCVENCGTCPAGSECCQVTESGIRGCMLPGCTDFLPDPPDCKFTGCMGNTGCFTDGSRYWCVHLCSEDYGPCNDGDRRCEANTVRECQSNAWVKVETCDSDTQICEDGACRDLQSCSMQNGAGDCPQGEMCFPWNQACTVFNCWPAGTVAVGGACDYLTDCVPGAICMDDSLCHQVCSGSISCTGTDICEEVTDCPTDFGVCSDG
jgi:hypothetical protein